MQNQQHSTPSSRKLVRRFAQITAFALAGLLMFAVVVFALAFYASEDAKRLSAYYQQLQPLQTAIEQQSATPSLAAALPSNMRQAINIAADGSIRLSLHGLTDLPQKFQAATLIITPNRTTQPWQWSCVYDQHPDWHTYVPSTCANASKPIAKK